MFYNGLWIRGVGVKTRPPPLEIHDPGTRDPNKVLYKIWKIEKSQKLMESKTSHFLEIELLLKYDFQKLLYLTKFLR